ncbi:MAG TPA: 30S ribosomal protein S20 [Firmicutes bacterium]|nr:30S ribosomal protein S20 [Bacillota bacterium]
MANIKSAKKRLRQTITRTTRNQGIKSSVKTYIRQFEESLQTGDRELAYQKLTAAIRQIDRAWSKGVLPKNNAARKKSRLTRMFNQINAG